MLYRHAVVVVVVVAVVAVVAVVVVKAVQVIRIKGLVVKAVAAALGGIQYCNTTTLLVVPPTTHTNGLCCIFDNIWLLHTTKKTSTKSQSTTQHLPLF